MYMKRRGNATKRKLMKRIGNKEKNKSKQGTKE